MKSNLGNAEHLPILIGVTGKRELGKAERDRVQAELQRLFADLDKRFPFTPKVLLTGGAKGVDTIAANVVLRGNTDKKLAYPGWLSVMVLPFEQELFEQDFDTQEERDAFRQRATDPRNIVYALPRLRKSAEESSIELVAREEIDRTNAGRDPECRRQHYEQLGLWLAVNATILIAVMPEGETAQPQVANAGPGGASPAKTGGTARVAAFRRSGWHDNRAADIAARSLVLHKESRLDEPTGGFLWLLDPALADEPRILRPIQFSHNIRKGGQSVAEAAEQIYRRPGSDPIGAAWPGTDHSRPSSIDTVAERRQWSLAIARGYEHFNRRDQAFWVRFSAAAADGLPEVIAAFARRIAGLADIADRVRVDPPSLEPPASYLQRVRNSIRSRQSTPARNYRWVLGALAMLFVVTVLNFEVWSEFWPASRIPLLLWLFTYAAIFVVYMLARWRQWQVLAEDYRGVMEVLRVQIAWWQAGIDDFAGHSHLRSVDRSLTVVREAARPIVTWARIRARQKRPAEAGMGGGLPELQWAEIYDAVTPAEDAPRPSWIGSQIRFFSNAARAQQALVEATEAISSVLFFASPLIVICLLRLVACDPALLGLVRSLTLRSGLLGAAGGGAIILVVAFIFWRWVASGIVRRLGEQRDNSLLAKYAWRYRQWLYLTAAFPVAATGTAAVILALAPLDGGTGTVGKCPGTAVTHGLAILVVMLPAIAGALRFYVDRRNHQAQALHYDDMHRAFLRAQDQFRRLSPTTNSGNVKAAQMLVRDLGILALDENESWLKAHRERPAEPLL